jgi:ATP-dependent Lon protease
LVNNDKRQTNEIDYFKHKLSNKEQQGIMTDLKEINRTIYAETPYRLSLLQSKIPSKFKAVAMQRLNTLKSMDQGDHEYYKIKNWVDAFMRIPFGVYRNINVRMEDGLEACDKFMNTAKQTLDN